MLGVTVVGAIAPPLPITATDGPRRTGSSVVVACASCSGPAAWSPQLCSSGRSTTGWVSLVAALLGFNLRGGGCFGLRRCSHGCKLELSYLKSFAAQPARLER